MMQGTRTWLAESVTIKPFSSLDSYGEYSHGTGATVACRTDLSNEQIVTEDGTAIYATGKFTVDGSVEVNVKDKLVLADGEERLVRKVAVYPGPNGTPYLKVIYV